MRKVIQYIIGAIILLLIIIGANLYMNNMFTCKITNIKIGSIDNDFMNYILNDKEIFLLNQKEISDMSLQPNKYKYVAITCDATNYSSKAIYNLQARGKYNNDLAKIVVGKKINMVSSDCPINVDSFDSVKIVFEFVIKADGKSNEEIIQYIKKSQFTLTGKRGTSLINFKVHTMK